MVPIFPRNLEGQTEAFKYAYIVELKRARDRPLKRVKVWHLRVKEECSLGRANLPWGDDELAALEGQRCALQDIIRSHDLLTSSKEELIQLYHRRRRDPRRGYLYQIAHWAVRQRRFAELYMRPRDMMCDALLREYDRLKGCSHPRLADIEQELDWRSRYGKPCVLPTPPKLPKQNSSRRQ